MNYYTLRFLDEQFEAKYIQEQFAMKSYLLKRVIIFIALASIPTSISQLILGKEMYGLLLIGFAITVIVGYYFSSNRIWFQDILILIIQLVLNSIYPIIICLDESDYFDQKHQDPFGQYTLGLMIAYFSLTYSLSSITRSMLGSKYYLKALPFIYSVVLQYILIAVKGISLTFPYKLLFVASAICAIVHLYYMELGKRRNFISVQQNNICNQNVLSNFRTPYFQCNLDEFSMKLIQANGKAKQKFNIIDQPQFLKVLRSTLLEAINDPIRTITLEKFLYMLIQNQEETSKFHPVKDVIVLIGTYNKQQFKYYISKYLDEEKKHIIMVNIQKHYDYSPKTLEILHNTVLDQLQTTMITKVEPLMIKSGNSSTLNYYTHQIFLDLFNCLIYSNYKIKEQLSHVNLTDIIKHTLNSLHYVFKNKKLIFKGHIPPNLSLMLTKKRYLQVLIGNILRQCVELTSKGSLISLKVTETSLFEIELKFTIWGNTNILTPITKELQISGFIVNQLGPLTYIYCATFHRYSEIRFTLYRSHLQEELIVSRKVSECNFIKHETETALLQFQTEL